MRLVALCTCFGLTIISVTLLAVGISTNHWWESEDKTITAGLWEQCSYDEGKGCISFEELFDIARWRKKVMPGIKDKLDEEKNRLDYIRAFAITSFVLSCFTLLAVGSLIYFVKRRTAVKIALWLKFITAAFNTLAIASGITTTILADDYESVFHDEMKLRGSWICVVMSSALLLLTGFCLLVTFYFKNKQQTSNPIVNGEIAIIDSITKRTLHHQHPYIQYYADEKEPHTIDDGNSRSRSVVANGSYSMTQLSDFSSQQYADLVTDPNHESKTVSSSYENVAAHVYEEIPVQR